MKMMKTKNLNYLNPHFWSKADHGLLGSFVKEEMYCQYQNRVQFWN